MRNDFRARFAEQAGTIDIDCISSRRAMDTMQGAMATTPWKQTFRKLSAVTVLEQSISSTLDSCNDDVYLYGFVCELQFHAVGGLRAELKLMGFIAPASRYASTLGMQELFVTL